MIVRYKHAKCPFECQTISENIQKLKQEKFKDFQVFLYKFKALNFCFQIEDVGFIQELSSFVLNPVNKGIFL